MSTTDNFRWGIKDNFIDSFPKTVDNFIVHQNLDDIIEEVLKKYIEYSCPNL